MEPDPDPFTYRGLNKDPDPVFNKSEPSGNRRIGDLFIGLHMGGSDQFNTKTNNQTEPVGFLINRSDSTDKKDLNRTEPNGSVRLVKPLFFFFFNQTLKISK